MSTQNIINELDRQYNIVISLPEKAFFVGIANYVKTVTDNSELTPIINELYSMVKLDYEEVKRYQDITKNIGNPKTMKDLIKAGKIVGTSINASKNLQIKEQTNAGHAWIKLETLGLIIHDPSRVEKAYSKTLQGQHEYKVMKKELDMILSSAENEYENEEYTSWVESDIKKSRAEIPRSIFVKEDYLNYLTQVHAYFMRRQSTATVFSTIVFPEGETVLYTKGMIYFYIGNKIVPDSIDLSTSPDLKKTFDILWEHLKRTGKNTISHPEVLALFKDLHDEEIESSKFASDISHFRTTKINKKPHLKERIEINFDPSIKSWKFNWR